MFGSLGFVIYFLPTLVALVRNSRKTGMVFFLNLFLGWTIIGWVVMLVLAATSETKVQVPGNGMMRCASCGGGVSPAFRYCPNCRAQVMG